VTIVGMGNTEMGDDGIGVLLTRMVSDQPPAGGWPGSVEFVCAERDPALAAALLAEGKQVLLVDAVDMKGAPGSWRVFSPHELVTRPDAAPGGSSHTLSLAGVMELARSLGWAERLRILGIQVGDVRPGRFLSPGVQRCVPEVLTRIREEAEALS
jgi:hydrogenase maturation protease